MNIGINDNLLFAVVILVLGIVLIAILIYLGVCRRYRSIDKYIDKLFKSKTPSKSYKSYEEISNQFPFFPSYKTSYQYLLIASLKYPLKVPAI